MNFGVCVFVDNVQSCFVLNEDGEIGVEKDKKKMNTPIRERDTYTPSDINVFVKKGDLFQLGEHRLLCGDATNEDDVLKLIQDEKVDITFTSPPYNSGGRGGYNFDKLDEDMATYYSKSGMYNSFKDDLNDEDYTRLLVSSAKLGLKYTDMVLYNIGVLKGNKIGLCNLLFELKDYLSDILVWDKGNTAMPLGMESQKHMVKHDAEFVFCFNCEGNRSFYHSQWSKGTKTNILRINSKRGKCSKVHKATFPLEFALEFVMNFTDSSVLDLFGGTGTTLIACQELGKKCFMMELDPLYCQVIINRWEEFTGDKARKI